MPEETHSVPLGPVQAGGEYYANSRMGCNTLGVVAIKPNGKKVHCAVLTRALEKSAVLAHVGIQQVIQELRERGHLDGIKQIILWSDVGPSFRSWLFLSMVAIDIAGRLQLPCEVNFLLEKHGKNLCDSWFAILARRRRMSSVDRTIDSYRELIQAIQNKYI